MRPEWLSRPFSEYEPPGGNESDGEDEATRAAARRRKGARRDREKEREEEEEEEKDDRLYCVCRQLYDPDVSRFSGIGAVGPRTDVRTAEDDDRV